jgi:hypothetical protein
MVRTRQLQVGDKVKVLAIPQGLDDTAGIGTPKCFSAHWARRFEWLDLASMAILSLS